MIGRARKGGLRDPQAGVPFRPAMLVHAGSLSGIAQHRIIPVGDQDEHRRGALLPWSLAMAGMMGAFFLGTSWSSAPQLQTSDLCLMYAPVPGTPPSR